MSRLRRHLISQSMDWYTPLTFTALSEGSTIKLIIKKGTPTTSGLLYKYQYGDDWSSYVVNTTITLSNVGDKVYFKNLNSVLSSNWNHYLSFVMTGEIAASGNIQSLCNYSHSCGWYSYYYLFQNCSSLIIAPELPATSLSNKCYSYMFSGCKNLIEPPSILPAERISDSGYAYMFYGCTSLLRSPEIMCTNTPSGNDELDRMFYGCSSLSEIRVHFTRWVQYDYWVQGVSSTGTFYKPSALPEEYGVSKIPSGWTVINID